MQPFGHKGRLEDERMLKGSGRYVADWNLVKKGLALAAEELEAAPADVEFLEGKYRIKGTDREVALAALAKKHPGRLDVDLKEKKVGTTFPNGCHIAEVEIEAETGIAEIVRYVACDDAGNIINHQIVEGQMHGGITQGATVHLSFDDLVVDDVASVVAGDVADDFGDAGFRLDLDLGDVAAVGERRADFLFLQVHVEPAGMFLGERRQRDLAVGALDAVFAVD